MGSSCYDRQLRRSLRKYVADICAAPSSFNGKTVQTDHGLLSGSGAPTLTSPSPRPGLIETEGVAVRPSIEFRNHGQVKKPGHVLLLV